VSDTFFRSGKKVSDTFSWAESSHAPFWSGR
jgi:hypothetical protein